MIKSDELLIGAKTAGGHDIPVYDDGQGPLWILRDSLGICGITRAATWTDAYSICEDEFFPEADETVEQLRQEYGYRTEHIKVVKDASVLVATEHTAIGERMVNNATDYPDGKLAPQFLRWVSIDTPDADAWPENECFCEGFGFRPNGPNDRDTLNHGIYAKDSNGESLDQLTPEMLKDWGITLDIEAWS
jgi:hypothetical protein